MPIEFVILGIFLIWSLFYLRINNAINIVLIFSLLFLFFGCFYRGLIIGNFSTNVFVCIGAILFVVYLFFKSEKFSGKVVENSCYCLIVYACLNLISIEFNSFFNCLPLVIIVLIIHLLNHGESSILLSVNLSLFVCELINAFFMFPKMNFSVIFSNEFVRCFVVLNLSIGVLCLFSGIFKRNKYEKSY